MTLNTKSTIRTLDSEGCILNNSEVVREVVCFLSSIEVVTNDNLTTNAWDATEEKYSNANSILSPDEQIDGTLPSPHCKFLVASAYLGNTSLQIEILRRDNYTGKYSSYMTLTYRMLSFEQVHQITFKLYQAFNNRLYL
ncbi:hypothetical protein K08M3_50040 [Vibrio alginolyticus]|jgi:hypothetical protein|uniref:Uncharacterized protein n=1 Tax=Vibrio alginolyticus TaxID=663 RepID=A0A1W6U168_VIBAL|nr:MULTISPECIES: hypothetical protein [Vibrio harveyi group]ARP06514.1 hypothetical protein K04M1_49910 [Vibrio alginolyticus]ARP11619.1 hypothetical protein K04M3_50500 [Vibrio alginolyticus]ARP11642.1 hypothetical protein K04M3_50730 [Vibrio alginolyticus]ARP16700.1 hypothetical protein K04M5_50480 [Vibrio alginolyticus]ARP21719.1 hypothetical protein K05K4_50100 [Vibrio alginolyticus]